MIGDAKNPGLYLLAASDIFNYLAHRKDSGLSIMVSYFEIYCGKLFDLLNDRNKLHAREDAKQNINVVGLKRCSVNDSQGIFELINFGNSVRVTSTTGKNLDSSRSHAILQIYVLEGNRQKGLLSFIDLAGNERGADTYEHDMQTRIDGAEISKSLLALKECIRALDQDKKHVPFRGSKLTMVLKDSFIGNCKTVMIGNVSPTTPNCEYTLNTLRYADRVKELKKDAKDKDRTGPKNELMLPRQANNVLKYDVKTEQNPFAFATPFNQFNNSHNQISNPLTNNNNNGYDNYNLQNFSGQHHPQSFINPSHNNANSNNSFTNIPQQQKLNQNLNPIARPLRPKKPSDRDLSPRSSGRGISNPRKAPQPLPNNNHNFANNNQINNVSGRQNIQLLKQQEEEQNVPEVQENMEQMSEQHEELINRILEDEELLIKKHHTHIKLMTNSTDIEYELLEEVDKPGSDIEEYISELEKLLDEKISSILGIKNMITSFKGNLNEERRLNEKIHERKNRGSFEILNLDNEVDELEL